jgi:glucosamine--fructose-6-phosphate aminotransferase (isomerizing)
MLQGSTMDRESNFALQIKAGPEKAVASTKATTAQLAILTLLAYACAGKLAEGKQLLLQTQSQINDLLNPRYEDHIRQLAEKIAHVESMYVIGKGVNYAMALESSIKLQEISYIHAEGFASGELKHGPIALISEGTPVIALFNNDHTRQDVLSNCQEVKARGAFVIGVSAENNPVFDYWIKVPNGGETSGIINIIPIQLLSYHLGLIRKNDPDMPRNLAKSVTVK